MRAFSSCWVKLYFNQQSKHVAVQAHRRSPTSTYFGQFALNLYIIYDWFYFSLRIRIPQASLNGNELIFSILYRLYKKSWRANYPYYVLYPNNASRYTAHTLRSISENSFLLKMCCPQMFGKYTNFATWTPNSTEHPFLYKSIKSSVTDTVRKPLRMRHYDF